MSDPILYINNYAIPYADVVKWPALEESINYDSSFNIPDSREYTLDNTDPDKYDPKYSGSLFYGTKIFGLPVTVWDSDLNQFIARGVISNVSTDSGSKELTLEVTSQLSAISNTDCQYIQDGITPADAIYNMLTAPITLGSTTPLIDPAYLDKASFKYAAGVQGSNKCTCNINILKAGDDSKKYSDILPELTKIGHCFLYTHYDKIYIWQYRSNPNTDIIINDIIAGSYKDTYSLDEAFKVRNSYIVTYFNGANVAYAKDKDMDSISDFGESIFGIPSDDIGSSSSADFNVGIDNLTGATWCGDIGLDRFKRPILECEFALDYSYNSIKIGDVVGLNFDAFSNTPVLILSAGYNKTEYRIDYKGIFI